ncbi:hypothetical protein GCM10022290_16380 [Sagittula marina]
MVKDVTPSLIVMTPAASKSTEKAAPNALMSSVSPFTASIPDQKVEEFQLPVVTKYVAILSAFHLCMQKTTRSGL